MKQEIKTQANVLIDAKDMKYGVMYRGTVDPSILFIRVRSDNRNIDGVVLVIRHNCVEATLGMRQTGKMMLEPNGTIVKFTQHVVPFVEDGE